MSGSQRPVYSRNAILYPNVEPGWPLRLLHIPTMTSHERKGTNMYNDTVAPCYAVITYTWGRFRAPDGSPALPVKGTTWHIPPVKSDCFTVEAFQGILRLIEKSFDWVWLDVACIDQQNFEVKMSEVKRQVQIFQRAQASYAWLHSKPYSELEGHLNLLNQARYKISFEFAGRIPSDDESQEDEESNAERRKLILQYLESYLPSLEETLRQLFSDPWFTSLWTLQESILRRDAILLPQDAHRIWQSRPYEDDDAPSTLFNLMLACQEIYEEIRWQLQAPSKISEQSRKPAKGILAAIQRAGLQFDDARNPNLQYGAARFRETEFPLDRIYAIFEIYHDKIADTFPPTPSTNTLDALEDKFAESLNLATPILGQCFVHLADPLPDKSWRITQVSAVPERFRKIDGTNTVNSSHISLTKDGWALARGKACPLKVLCAYWGAMLRRGTTWIVIQRRPYALTTAYDHIVYSSGLATHSSGDENSLVECTGPTETLNDFSLCQALCDQIPPEDLYILVLGYVDHGRFFTKKTNAILEGKASGDNVGHLNEKCPQIFQLDDKKQLGAREEFIMAEQDIRWGLRYNEAVLSRKDAVGVIVLRQSGIWKRIGLCMWDDDNCLPHEFKDWSIELH